MATFGNRPEDAVTDKAGNVRPDVVITVYASESDALAQRSPLGSQSSGSDGRWPLEVAGKTLVWAREPNGSVWPVASETAVSDHETRLSVVETELPNKLDTASTDTQVTTLWNDTGSAFRTAADADLDATYVPKWKASTAYLAGQAVVNPAGDVVTAKADFTSGATYDDTKWSLSATITGKASLPAAKRNALTGWFHISGFPGADPTGASSSQAAVEAAYAAAAAYAGATMNSIASSGATVYVDGQYLLATPLVHPPRAILTRGDGRDISRLFNNTTDLFAWSALGSLVQGARFKDVALETGPTGGHVFNLDGTDGTTGLALAAFDFCTLRSRNTASSLWKQRGRAQMIEVKFTNCLLDAQGSRTVRAFDVVVGGNDANSVSFVGCRMHGHNTTAAPFGYVESTGAWNYNWTLTDCVGEQNGGGFWHFYSVDGVQITNCPDWDLAGTYQDDLFKFLQSVPSAKPSKNVTITKSYRIANAGGLASGKVDIRADHNQCVNIRIDKDCTPPGLTLTTSLNGGAYIAGLTAPFKIVTGNYAVLDTDPELILCNSATAMTLTLPAAISSKYGRRIVVKNIGAGAVTITPNVDGAAQVLPQWGKLAALTDGPTALLGRIWFTV